MKKNFLFIFLVFFFNTVFAQQIQFSYQTGLAATIKKIIPVPGSTLLLVADRNGAFIAWDSESNKILCRVTTLQNETGDIIFCSRDKKILFSGDKGIDVYDAGKLLMEQKIDFAFTYPGEWITALAWNEDKQILRAANNKGMVLGFNGLANLRAKKTSFFFNTTISGIFAMKELTGKLCILGIQEQGFFDPVIGKKIYSIRNYCTGMYGYAFDDRDSAIYLPVEAAITKLSYRQNRFTVFKYPPVSTKDGALVQGLYIAPESGRLVAGTNDDKIITISPGEKKVKVIYEKPEASYTAFYTQGNWIYAGDFFGNVEVLDIITAQKHTQLNEDITPSLNGVYLDNHGRMISTHFGLRGVALKIWDITAATLVQSFNFPANIAYDVGFSADADTIYSAHTDEAIYKYYKKGELYVMDTVAKPFSAFTFGSIFFKYDVDKKTVRKKTAEAFQQMLNRPGVINIRGDEGDETELNFVNTLEIPRECKDGKMPGSFRIAEAYLAASNLGKETASWDLLDKDIFYLRGCSSQSFGEFFSRVKEMGIDSLKAAYFFRVIKGQEKVPTMFFISTPSNNTHLYSFFYKEKPLHADISRMPSTAVFFFRDTVTIWDKEQNRAENIFTGMQDLDFYYDLNEKYFAIAGSNNSTITLVKRGNGGNKFSSTNWISFGEDDYLVHNPAGYYKTKGRSNRINFSIDSKPLSFQSFDIKYNRPDKVLASIGSSDTTLTRSYQKAWEKRIKKLGVDTAAFRVSAYVPEADFVNRNAISYQQTVDSLGLHIKGMDSIYILDRFNVWVNETPIFGQRGISIRKRNETDFDTTITIKLSQGENRIETSIANVNGTESYRMPLIVNYTPTVKQKETTRFIGIGIDQFADNQYNLQYCSKDIRDLSKKLKEKYGNDIIIDTLFNENVTISNVKALKQKLLQLTENDKVIVAYSGHGILSKEYDYYLSTYSVNFDKPEQNGLPYEELENLLDSIPARKKLLLIDACHSGEVDKEDLIRLNASSDSLIKGVEPVAYKQEGRIGLKNSFELMQSLFVNVGKSTGATIISAAAGTQFALEREDLKNGVFTFSILEAMNKYPTLRISELKKIVGERVEQITKGLQKPTSRNETIAVDWNVW